MDAPQTAPLGDDAQQLPLAAATPAIRRQPVQLVNIRTPARGRATHEHIAQDIGGLTPTPPGGFPEIHHAMHDALTRGMDPNCIRSPETAANDPVLYVQVFNIGYPASLQQARELTREITAAITAFSGETGFVVVPPVPPQGARLNPRDLPLTWPILGLTGGTVDRAATQHTLSYQTITLFAYRQTQAIPRWTIRLIGFTHNVGNQIQTMVREAFETGPIRRCIEEMAAENPDFAPWMEPSLRADALLHTLQVDVFVMSSGAIFANILMDSPTADPEVRRAWIEELHMIEFRSPYNAPARAQHTTRCEGCHSVAHPTHLCPFPHIPGWNGPQAGSGTYSANPAPGQHGADSLNAAEPSNRSMGSTRGGYNGPYAARGRNGRGRGHGRGFRRGAF